MERSWVFILFDFILFYLLYLILFYLFCILRVGFGLFGVFLVNIRDHNILLCCYSFSLVCFDGETQSFQVKEKVNIPRFLAYKIYSSASCNSDECHRNRSINYIIIL